MTRKNIKSIFLISLAGAGIWIAGFILILILDFGENTPAVSKVWLILVFFSTLIVSVAKNMKEDKNER